MQSVRYPGSALIRFLFAAVAGDSAGAALAAAPRPPQFEEFAYGFSIYPDIMHGRAEQLKLLDDLKAADVNTVRVFEAAWGLCEKEPGKYDFTWAKEYLDEAQKRGMKAVIGTGSFIPPQWLTARHPEALVEYFDGATAHPMGRRPMSLSSPIVRDAVGKYCAALAKAIGSHPAVIGWQLDNETDYRMFLTDQIDYSPASRQAFSAWVKQRYGTADKFNSAFHLREWGMEVGSLDDVQMYRRTNNGELLALQLLTTRFMIDEVTSFYELQRDALRANGAQGWITTNWVPFLATPSDYPRMKQVLDVSGVNVYGAVETFGGQYDLNRSAYKPYDHFLFMETSIETRGGVNTHERFFFRMVQPAAYGASALLHWSANRWSAGMVAEWYGLEDWSGQMGIEYAWAQELGAFYKKWGHTLVTTSVDAQAAVLTDTPSRAVLGAFKRFCPKGEEMLWQSFNAFHRLGIGVDALTPAEALQPELLNRYKVIVLSSQLVLVDQAVIDALRGFVECGGLLIVNPLCEYQNEEGAFNYRGLNGKLSVLTGVQVRAVRRQIYGNGNPEHTAVWKEILPGDEARAHVGLDGFVEQLEAKAPDVQALAAYATADPVIDGALAGVRRQVGKGQVFKFGFWADDDSFVRFLATQLGGLQPQFVHGALPKDIQCVPRTDGSMFVMNTGGTPVQIAVAMPGVDRIRGQAVSAGRRRLGPYEVLWLGTTP